MKEIKDYLPYYIGCEIQVTYISVTSGEQRTVNRKMDSPFALYSTINGMDYGYESVKPILRRVEDITEDEVREVAPLLESGYIEGNAKAPSIHKYFFTPKAVAWYLSKGFDLFGLIDAGLCLDAKTLEK